MVFVWEFGGGGRWSAVFIGLIGSVRSLSLLCRAFRSRGFQSSLGAYARSLMASFDDQYHR